jgi:hypothetical protein
LYGILSSYSPAHFYFTEKSAKLLHYFGLDCGLLEFFKYSTLSCPPNIKCMVPAFLGGWFGGKDCGLCTYNPPAEEDGFLYEAARN